MTELYKRIDQLELTDPVNLRTCSLRMQCLLALGLGTRLNVRQLKLTLASFPVPRPAFHRLHCKRRKAGRGTGVQATNHPGVCVCECMCVGGRYSVCEWCVCLPVCVCVGIVCR